MFYQFPDPFSSPEPTILLACGRNRELWEQPFQACAIDADYVRPNGQNSVISFVISKWLLQEGGVNLLAQLWDCAANDLSHYDVTREAVREISMVAKR